MSHCDTITPRTYSLPHTQSGASAGTPTHDNTIKHINSIQVIMDQPLYYPILSWVWFVNCILLLAETAVVASPTKDPPNSALHCGSEIGSYFHQLDELDMTNLITQIVNGGFSNNASKTGFTTLYHICLQQTRTSVSGFCFNDPQMA